jgi:ribosomal protein S12 methylthiotransferase
MNTVALITFGCAKNLIDSEVMLGYLHRAGYHFISDPAAADIIILNTCGFIRPAKDEAEAAIRDALNNKSNQSATKIIVTGCYAERYKETLRTKYPSVDAWVGVKDFDKIVQVVRGERFSESSRTFLYSHASPRVVSTPGGSAYVKVSEGCSHQCSFCAIPLIKGAYRSRPTASIVEEVQALAARGVKEINLISQDTTYFGTDQNKTEALPRLFQKLIHVRGIEWIRMLYGYPEEITDRLLEVMQDPKICPYLDIPFQHSDPVLIHKMKRAMDGRRALKLLNKIRQIIPGISIRTSLVVGFPGEGPKEFQSLVHFVKEARFDHLGVFTYSREEGTSAESLGDPVPESVKRNRKNKILDIQAEISSENLRPYIGRTIAVLMEGAWQNNSHLLVGRAQFQAPEVDGCVFVEAPNDRQPLSSPLQKVEILASDVYDLHGRFAR